jgi:hypothetical protein
VAVERTLSFQASSPHQSLLLVAISDQGLANVRVDGTYQGKSISEVFQVLLAPFQVTIGTQPTIPVGTQSASSVTLKPAIPQSSPEGPSVPYLMPYTPHFQGVQLHSSDNSVLEIGPGATLGYTLTARKTGTVLLDFGPNAPPEFANVSARVQVIAARIDLGPSPIRIPAGTQIYLTPSSNTSAPAVALKAVRLRLTAAGPSFWNVPAHRKPISRWTCSGTMRRS